jgi:hypothetical protein
MSDTSPLRAALEEVTAETGCSLKDLTVLAVQRDPFRLDTPANHALGQWLADTAATYGLGNRKIHARGLHYLILGQDKPDGSPYENTDDEWVWMSEKALKAARWLGYIPWEQIEDHKNDAPVVREFSYPDPYGYLSARLDVYIPEDIKPVLYAEDFRGVQPYHLIMIGEKSSLSAILTPIAERYEADLYLPSGEMSDTLIHRIAETSIEDGRPMVVLYFADCDPAGHQMIVSVTRKLQAFAALNPELPDFEAHRVALTPAQVGEYGLPSTPMKPTELRASKWREAFGIEQTEVDALISLRPDLLRQLATEALDTFTDTTLARRVDDYRNQWLDSARTMNTFDMDRLAEIRADAETKLTAMRQQIEEMNSALRMDIDQDDLPPIDLPEAYEPEGNGTPLLDSRWGFAEQCKALIDSKAYRTGEDES